MTEVMPRVLSFGGGEMARRFWAKVTIGAEDECWPWKGKPNEKGYGRFCFNWTVSIASRVAYELTHGPLSDGYHALHKCDNPICCNPNHLFAGTILDNNADMRAKGRGVNPPVCVNSGCFGHGRSISGEHHPLYKLTWADVRAMRAQFTGRHGERTLLAEKYGISLAQASKILRNEAWIEEVS